MFVIIELRVGAEGEAGGPLRDPAKGPLRPLAPGSAALGLARP